ncbi:hypothetical protein GCM10027199_70550 [Amycolatopsis magusensis]
MEQVTPEQLTSVVNEGRFCGVLNKRVVGCSTVKPWMFVTVSVTTTVPPGCTVEAEAEI